eukprot:3394647-Rhodomonas_salina.1
MGHTPGTERYGAQLSFFPMSIAYQDAPASLVNKATHGPRKQTIWYSISDTHIFSPRETRYRLCN